MQYENQKPLQTVVGTLPWPGTEFFLSEKKIDLLEGKTIKVTAKAGGARKVFWIIKSGESERIVDVDRLEYTLNAGRLAADQSLTLQFRAVFADGVKTIDVPVTIKDDIPEPVFTLKAPAPWNGRDPIKVVSQIAYLQAMQAKGAGGLKVDWTVSGLAVVKEVAPGKLILKRAQNSGKMTVTAADLRKAYYSTDKKDEIILEFDQPVAWLDALAGQFHLDDQAGKVVSDTVSGNVITLKLAAPAAKTITYLMDKKWDSKTLLYGKNGIVWMRTPPRSTSRPLPRLSKIR